ncbi:MAG: signal peptidase II [Myxococcales bacterium]|nr:signal peptidase II [Myxococcales bacterium]
MNRRNVVFALFAVVGFLLDQGTKAWIVANVEYGVGEIKVIDGLFSIVHAQNPGAAFGLFGNFEYRHYLFLVFTIIAGVVIVDIFRKLPVDDWFMSSALGMILSGALGNAIDRARQQYVTDFLRFYTENDSVVGFLHGVGLPAEYPSFNIADAALVIGVGMFIFHNLFLEKKEEDDKGDSDGATNDEASPPTEPEPSPESEPPTSDVDSAESEPATP